MEREGRCRGNKQRDSKLQVQTSKLRANLTSKSGDQFAVQSICRLYCLSITRHLLLISLIGHVAPQRGGLQQYSLVI